MKYRVERTLAAPPSRVFAALHQYKIDRRPMDLFASVLPPRLVKVDFTVLSAEPVGLGACYRWQFKIFGLPILRFTERVVEWTEGRSVSYRAVSGWKMFFRVELEPVPAGTLLRAEIDFSPLGASVPDRLLSPVVRWGLNRVFSRLARMVESPHRSGQLIPPIVLANTGVPPSQE